MVNQIIVGIITWLHVVSVIGWTGAALTFLVSLRSTLPKLSPQASGEFVVKVMPRFLKSVQVFTILTLVFGPSLAFTMNDGPPNQFNLVSPWSIFVTMGASVGIAMLFVVFFLFTPTANGLVQTVKQMQQNPDQPPPPKFSILQKRLAMIPPLGVTLLLLAEAFMVTAAQF